MKTRSLKHAGHRTVHPASRSLSFAGQTLRIDHVAEVLSNAITKDMHIRSVAFTLSPNTAPACAFQSRFLSFGVSSTK